MTNSNVIQLDVFRKTGVITSEIKEAVKKVVIKKTTTLKDKIEKLTKKSTSTRSGVFMYDEKDNTISGPLYGKEFVSILSASVGQDAIIELADGYYNTQNTIIVRLDVAAQILRKSAV